MHLELLDSIAMEVLPTARIERNPRWMLDGRTVLIGPYHSSDEHERHVGQTIGSTDWLWSASDELRFDTKTLILQSVMLTVPDATLPSDLSLASWQTAPRESGLLRLLTAKNFRLEPTDFRWMDAQGKALTCLYKAAVEMPQKQQLRLRIAQNLEFFFADEKFCGWSLIDPGRFVVNAWEEPAFEEVDEQFVVLLHGYLELVTDPYIEQMEDKSPKLLEALLDLYTRIQDDHSSSMRSNILRAAVADKLDRFYDQKVN